MFINVLASCTVAGREIPIPTQLSDVTSLIYHIILIGVPLLLIVFGMWDLGKAVMAQKEDEIKKGQQIFVKRLIAAVIVFFVLIIVDLIIPLIAGEDGEGIMSCVKSLLGA